ncbi:MAG: hypothetical protein AAFO95_07955 [Cyanobacteria bacterium J06600_6]
MDVSPTVATQRLTPQSYFAMLTLSRRSISDHFFKAIAHSIFTCRNYLNFNLQKLAFDNLNQ